MLLFAFANLSLFHHAIQRLLIVVTLKVREQTNNQSLGQGFLQRFPKRSGDQKKTPNSHSYKLKKSTNHGLQARDQFTTRPGNYTTFAHTHIYMEEADLTDISQTDSNNIYTTLHYTSTLH